MSTDTFKYSPSPELAEVLRVGFVTASYNAEFVENLYQSAYRKLLKLGVPEDMMERQNVPGANEIPYLVHRMIQTEEFDVIVALGVVIAGDTQHHVMIERTTGMVLQQIGLQTGVPVINGIITTETREQAEARAGSKINRGEEFALAALWMAEHKMDFDARVDDLDMDELSLLDSLDNN